MSDSSGPIQPLLRELRRLVEEAGAKTMVFYQRPAAVSFKSDASPLTEADRASHEFLVGWLPGLLPGVPVVSEESPEADRDSGASAERYWLVDPLDGTKEFLKGTGEFTVNVALVERGRPVLGVVHAPVLGLTYLGGLGEGAFRQQGPEQPSPIRVKAEDPARYRVVASRDHAGPLVQALLARMPNAELKSMGSSLKFCLVAEGEADLYLRDVPTMEWDTAAAQCVVEAAGGRVCTLDGLDLHYGKPGLKNPAVIALGDPDLPWGTWLSAAGP